MQWNQSRGEGNRLLDPARLIRLCDYIWILDHFVFQTFLHSVILTASKRVLSAAAISGESCNKIQAEFPASYLGAYTAAPQSLANIWDYCE